jgi:hypothetical protein
MSNEIEAMDRPEFEDAKSRISDMRTTWLKHVCELKEMFGRMSKPQLNEVKKLLKGFVSAEHIERLALCGRGELPEWIAYPAKSLPAGTCRRLSRGVRKQLSDPDIPVEVFTTRGVQHKRLGKLDAFQLAQVVDPERGIIDASAQSKRALMEKTKPEKPVDSDLESVADWVPCSGGVLMKSAMGVRLKATRKQIEQMYGSFSRCGAE